jgi:hypothetical protein
LRGRLSKALGCARLRPIGVSRKEFELMAFLEAGAAMLLLAAAQPAAQGRQAPVRQAPARTAPAAPAPRPAPPRPQGPSIPTRVAVKSFVGLCAGDKGACLTYVLGAADAFSSALAAAGRPQIFCFPAGTPNQAIADTALQYVRARPQESGNNAALAIVAGLAAIYPCPK